MATRVDALLRRIQDPALREEIAAALQDLRDQTAFGLTFERHLPERVRLPRQALYRGARVEPREGSEVPAGTVGRVRDGQATVVSEDGSRTQVPVDELVVVRDFGQPIYPGLTPLDRLELGGDRPDHVVIRGENFHALEALQYTHQGLVDVIYIDPPYNTGGDLIYNDRYVSGQDSYRHSKWLSFMEKRLLLAKALLRGTGVIIVAIDDNEHAHLKVLMDAIFGEANFLTNAVWQGGGKNDARFSSGGLDYMLVYGRDRQALVDADVRWVEKKRGYEALSSAGAEAWASSGGDAALATRTLRVWLRANKVDIEPGLWEYNKIDDEGRIYRRSDLRSPNPRPNLQYDLEHPLTRRPVAMHPNGWVYSPETMSEKIAEGRILFGPDETTSAGYKRYLTEVEGQAIRSVVTQERRYASQALTSMLGEKRFDYPKDVDVLERWIGAVAVGNAEAVVLDFFAGSGSTFEAVARLNARDGGRRQCILVTNNEVNERVAARMRRSGLRPGDAEWEAEGIFENVTRPRITATVTGDRATGERGEAFAENVTFLGLEYLDPDDVRRGRSFSEVAHLLWLKAGAIGPCITEQEGPWALPARARYGVLFEVGAWSAFAESVEQHDVAVTTVYIITDSRSAFTQARKALGPEVDAVHLYENYLTTFTINGTAQ